MIKRTLYFANPCYLKSKNKQLVLQYPDSQIEKSVPIEDIGFIVLESQQITITHHLLAQLAENNVVVVTCNSQHMPSAMQLPLHKNTLHTKRIKEQINISVPLKKQLWQQTVRMKIHNQAQVIQSIGENSEKISHLSRKVLSGDSTNIEATAANLYWQKLFPTKDFKRGNDEDATNHYFNYGYAILRAVCARAIVGSGLLPSLGLMHSNQYNPYCLADDIMEPYRPFVDQLVLEIINKKAIVEQLTPSIKLELLKTPVIDVSLNGKRHPLAVGMEKTTASLVQVFSGNQRKIAYPELVC